MATRLNTTVDLDSDSNEDFTAIASQKGRKNIRNIKQLEDLKLETIRANRNEKERIIRIERIENKFKEAFSGIEFENELILDYDFQNNIPIVSVNEVLVKKMKSHQREGVKFMWYACYESLEQTKMSEGSGCIIAHCMGLGKTFQVIALVHTLLSHMQVGTRTVLICCPKNTLLNWINEFQLWITPDLGTINIYNPTRFDSFSERLREIAKWQTNGGVCIINYELFRILLEDDSKGTNVLVREKQKCQEYLSNPGPDLVICDEGHVLKNEETKLSKIMSQIRTLRRIVLTGTPMQNNLKEYHCMIQFVKPNLLGNRNEFTNMFVNPILNGQYENSLVEDVQLMKERSHVLHKRLMGCVQRFDLSTLKMFLPEKQEYVISVALTDAQIVMYKYYMNNYSAKADPDWKDQSVALFADFMSLQRIWTHPYTLKNYGEKHREDNLRRGRTKSRKRKKKRRLGESESDGGDSSDPGVWSRYPLSWWVRFATVDDVEDARASNKLVVLLNILKECEEADEKILVFSGSLYSLRMIEHFLQKINHSEWEEPSLCNMTSTWEPEQDYLVLTGRTSSEDRDRYCRRFNDVSDTRLRLFLISTKAGGMGINLTAANRAVLFDVSWNPSHDIQSIFRIYRIGQRKPCFVYRMVASGTMEEKIYERQVAKQSISFRVIDEKQIARHYTQSELLQLYQFEPNRERRLEVAEPKDPLLRKVLKEEPAAIIGIHEHESLLEHRKEEELHEMEKKDAWTAYSSVHNFENLPPALKTFVERLTPESFDPSFLKMVLQNEYKKATEAEVGLMMEQLMPRITRILEKPDFTDIMKREALLLHNSRPRRSRNKRRSYKRRGKEREAAEEEEEEEEIREKVDLTDDPSRSPAFLPSDSDDSIILCYVDKKRGRQGRRRRRRSKPLRSWGVRNGKEFGSPDRGSP